MKFTGLLALAVLQLPAAVAAQSDPALPVDRNSVWFKPSLTVDSAPICAELLRIEQDAFFSATERPDYSQAHLQLIDTAGDARTKLTRPDGQQIFVDTIRHGGCGGACETERIVVGDKFLDQPEPVAQNDDLPGTPRAPRWNIYKRPNGDFFALGIVDDRSSAYRIAGPSKVELACEVVLKPESFSNNNDPMIRRAWQDVEVMIRAYGSVAQSGGSCGSLNPLGLSYNRVRRGMEEALYRPWSTFSGYQPGDSSVGVAKWALGGIAEFRAGQQYRTQIERTSEDLGKFYQQKLGWSEAAAKERARRVIVDVLDRGFAFSSEYDPAASEQRMRQAVLERQPLEVIQKLELGDRSKDPDSGYGYTHDSILNIAIEYPEALRYLLSKGVDPNSANAFGKTPLMYAAQYNQLDAVRLLLAAGADPNAATRLPDDNCFYTLSTSGMTPLHYATRYASAALIRLLVDAEAATYMKTSYIDDPLYWLEKYTNGAEPENNPNINADEVPSLLRLLRVPDDRERRRLSAQLTTRAQAEYSRAEYELAYRHLKTALVAQSDNLKALADLPLMAAKVNKKDEAIAAAKRAIEVAASVPLRASAWFNLGLVCERGDSVLAADLDPNGCDTDWIEPFVTAWKLQPTGSRANKLRELFDKRTVAKCLSAGTHARQKLWAVTSGPEDAQVTRLYVLHPLADPLDIESNVFGRVERIALDAAVAITIFEGPPAAPAPRIGGHPCRAPIDIDRIR